MDSILALHPAAQGSILGAPEIYRALLSQWTVAFERTHLVQSKSSWGTRQAITTKTTLFSILSYLSDCLITEVAFVLLSQLPRV